MISLIKFILNFFPRVRAETKCNNELAWLSSNPISSIKHEVTRLILEESPNAKLKKIKLQYNPYHLMIAAETQLSNDLLLKRAGMMIPFEIKICLEKDHSENLRGIFSWIATDLDTDERHDTTYIDFDLDADNVKDKLSLYPQIQDLRNLKVISSS